jgi:hypothetical protein
MLSNEEKQSMKKVFWIIILILALAACSPQTELTDEQMATRVAQILTEEYVAPPATELPPPEAIQSTATTEPQQANTPEGVLVISATPTATVPTPTFTVTSTSTITPTPTSTETNTPEPSLTPPATDPRQVLGSPASTDPMNSIETWHWPDGAQEYTDIAFNDGYMELIGLQPVAGWRLPMTAAGTDMYIEMTVRPGECTGEDSYGIIFRIPVFHEADRGYLFSVSCDGFYLLTKWDGKAGENGQGWRLLDWRASEHIKPGANQVNRIGVMTYGNRFYLYANGYLLNDSFILEDVDNPYPGGHFGVFVSAKNTEDFTIYVDEMSYWLTAYKP